MYLFYWVWKLIPLYIYKNSIISFSSVHASIHKICLTLILGYSWKCRRVGQVKKTTDTVWRWWCRHSELGWHSCFLSDRIIGNQWWDTSQERLVTVAMIFMLRAWVIFSFFHRKDTHLKNSYVISKTLITLTSSCVRKAWLYIIYIII